MSPTKAFFEALQQALAEGTQLTRLHRRVKELEKEVHKLKAAQLQLKKKGKPTTRGKRLTPAQVNRCLELARRKANSLNWSVLTDEQEKCGRLRWQLEFPVGVIARSLGKHRKTIYEHLNRAKARLAHERDFERRKKRVVQDGL